MTKSVKSTSNHSSWLYEVVFGSRLVRGLVFCLLLIILSQPVLVVYAEEVVDDNEPDMASDVEITQSEDSEEIAETEAGTVEEEIQTVPTVEISETAVTEEVSSEHAAETTDETSDGTEAVDTPTKEDASEVMASSTASSSEYTHNSERDERTEAQNEVSVTHEVHTNDNYYQFSKDNCVRVADGSFYCDDAPAQTPLVDSFYVALDADGDREIFAVRKGETFQITHNTRDDAAPYYDSVSNSLVWHTLINGRYQIMSYSFDDEEEVQLTTGSVNSMEPSRYGAYTAWQEWGDDGWEVILFDGKTTTQITSNSYPDIAPMVEAEYVIWKRMYENEQVAILYNINGGTELEVRDSSIDTAFKNARFMLVYEGVTPTGETIITGVDTRSGKIVPIGLVPVEIPEEMPTSEPTPEVRALIQPKPSTVENDELEQVDGEEDLTATTSVGVTEPVVASTTDMTLVIPAASTTESGPVEDSVEAVEPEPEYEIPDLVIPPFASSTEQ